MALVINLSPGCENLTALDPQIGYRLYGTMVIIFMTYVPTFDWNQGHRIYDFRTIPKQSADPCKDLCFFGSSQIPWVHLLLACLEILCSM
jgi:hypothetical protein